MWMLILEGCPWMSTKKLEQYTEYSLSCKTKQQTCTWNGMFAEHEAWYWLPWGSEGTKNWCKRGCRAPQYTLFPSKAAPQNPRWSKKSACYLHIAPRKSPVRHDPAALSPHLTITTHTFWSHQSLRETKQKGHCFFKYIFFWFLKIIM